MSETGNPQLPPEWEREVRRIVREEAAKMMLGAQVIGSWENPARLKLIPPQETPLTGPELAESHGFPPLAESGAARVAGATSSESGGAVCTCKCTCAKGVVSSHCNIHGNAYFLTCPLHYAQPESEGMKRIFELIKPADCPDPGPAKDAATQAASATTTPAPQRGTATGALSLEQEAVQLARDWSGGWDEDALREQTQDIIALVKKHVEEANAKAIDAILDLAESKGSSHAIQSLRAIRHSEYPR